MKEELDLINKWNNIINMQIESIQGFMKNFSVIHQEYLLIQRDKENIGFNIFNILTNKPYLEDYHSDIINSILNSDTKNVSFFINCLNLFDGFRIDLNDFKNTVIEREIDRIDISIKDTKSKKAIIIENKINNAQDTYRQLPKYYKKLRDKNYLVVAIVYIPLVKGKIPERTNWTEQEKREIEKKLIILPAYDRTSINICDNWLEPAIINSNSIDILSIIRQYKKLLKHLTLNSMDTVIMQKFYDLIIKEEDNFSTAHSISNLLGNLNDFRAWKLKEQFDKQASSIFNKSYHFKYGGDFRTKFEKFKYSNNKFDLIFKIVCFDNCYLIEFREHENTMSEGKEKLKKMLHKCNFSTEFDRINEFYYSTKFKFPEEENKMYDFISKILDSIKNIYQKEQN